MDRLEKLLQCVPRREPPAVSLQAILGRWSARRRRVLVTTAGAAVLLVAVALLVRLAPLDHGMPRSYVPDTHVVRNAMGMLRDRNPVPEAGRYSTYPYLVPYLLLPVYATEYAVGRATGAWAGAATGVGRGGNAATARAAAAATATRGASHRGRRGVVTSRAMASAVSKSPSSTYASTSSSTSG